MREIRFRAWLPEEKEMQMVHDIHFNEDGSFWRIRFYSEGHNYVIQGANKYELMQFTGLKDKNGKEVYEDDIIEFENQGKYVIIYREDSAMFYVRPTTNGEQIPIWLEYSNQNCPYEVIGNIYENPELMEG